MLSSCVEYSCSSQYLRDPSDIQNMAQMSSATEDILYLTGVGLLWKEEGHGD